MIEWPLVEIGPGTLYTATRDLPIPSDAVADSALGASVDAQDDSVAGEGSEATSDIAQEQLPAPEASATPAGSAEDIEALFPPEVLAELRARGSDITVVGFPFDEPGETIISSEEAEENDVSLLNVWSYYARSGAEAQGAVENGEACVNVGGETTLFRVQDVGLNYVGFPLVADQSYRLFFEAYADEPIYFRSLVGLALAPYTESFAQVEVLGTQKQTFLYTFEAKADSDVNRLGFMLGGNQDAFRVCFDNVVLSEAGGEEPTLADSSAADEADASPTPSDAPAVGDAFLIERFDEGEAQGWSSYASQQAQMDYEISDGEVCAVAGGGRDSDMGRWPVTHGPTVRRWSDL